jgi:hypothetical protein
MALFAANQAFCFDGPDGVPRMFTKGELISDNDPGYKGREALFEPVEVAAERPIKQAAGLGGEVEVEDASAEPNAKRSLSTARRHKAQDAAAKESEEASHFPDKEWVDKETGK